MCRRVAGIATRSGRAATSAQNMPSRAAAAASPAAAAWNSDLDLILSTRSILSPPLSSDPIRVVVIDDSAYNRQTITQMLESDPDVRVVARAADGDEGLKLVFQHQPDVVTLDLEMPKMDGFTFLRILMSRRATPVLVISSYAAKENVFKALELGALDFIAKPGRQVTPDLRGINDELLEKVKLVRQLRVVTLGERAQAAAAATPPQIPATRMPVSAPP